MNDTDPRADRIQLDLLRKAGPTRRAAMCLALTQSVIDLSRRALREKMPDAPEQEIRLRWLALTYGADLAARVRAKLDGIE